MRKFSIILFLHYFFIACPLMAQELNSTEQNTPEDMGEMYHALNHLTVFAGGTTMLEKNVSYFTLSLNYLHKFSESSQWSASAFTEKSMSMESPTLITGLVYLWEPVGEVKKMMIQT